jgi:hypothetical protein
MTIFPSRSRPWLKIQKAAVKGQVDGENMCPAARFAVSALIRSRLLTIKMLNVSSAMYPIEARFCPVAALEHVQSISDV